MIDINMENNKLIESVFTKKVKAGKRRTYFFDVRKTKGEDFFISITESTKKPNQETYERHKIFLYKEDFHRFAEGLNEAIQEIKTKHLPDFDYDSFAHREQEHTNTEGNTNQENPSLEW